MEQEPVKEEFEQIDLEEKLNEDFVFFVDFVHKRLENEEFIWSPYNKRIAKELMNVYKLNYLLLVINLPPRLGKTVLVTYFQAWTNFKSKKTYNNYYSYSEMLIGRYYVTIAKIFKIPQIAEFVEKSFKR